MSQTGNIPDKSTILTLTAAHVEPGTMPDEIGGPTTDDLAGVTLEYTYETGRKYRLRFTNETVSFLLMSIPDQPERTLLYRAREVAPKMYLVHWLVPGRVGHVSLVIDFERNIVHVSALMPGQVEFFDIATIAKYEKA
jgi:hypothetical protein